MSMTELRTCLACTFSIPLLHFDVICNVKFLKPLLHKIYCSDFMHVNNGVHYLGGLHSRLEGCNIASVTCVPPWSDSTGPELTKAIRVH